MKKTIVYLSLALVAFAGTTTANAASLKVATEVSGTYGNNTPMAVAIMKGDLETIKKFVEYGADVNERSNGLTPLMLAARYNKVDIIIFLLENGAKLRDTDEKGNTALKYAQISKAAEAVEVLKKAASA
jgi:ankyrin repeat protein